ncbi:MAG: response regulator [Candidatus Melainabacteria bacterium]|nr:response regulator [Candidatus Melainabacteria bacterium]
MALSCYSIPAALWIFVQKRKDLTFHWAFLLFCAFIFWCGTTHVMKLWTIWHKSYGAEAIVDLITGVLSAAAAILLWSFIPKALSIRSSQQWEEANRQRQESLEQQKQAEKHLHDSEERTRLIIQCAYDAFVAINNDSIITDWNAQAEKIFGWSKAEIIGRTLTETIIPQQFRDAHMHGVKHFATTGEGRVLNKRMELSALRKDGTEFPIELSIFPVQSSGTITFCAFIQDITERKEIEKALLSARDQALEASRFKSDFVANMSHEIRTPMNGIFGMTEILLRSGLTERQHEYASTIKEAGQSLLSVINDILDFSKIEAGKLALDVVEFAPIKLVESIAELLAAAARQKDIYLLTFIDPQIPMMVHGDQGRLRQILMNLASNAIKFSDQGGVLIRATLESHHDNVVRIKFSVTDKGIGMSKQEINQLYQPFVQMDESHSRKFGGSGLGLSISKSLVELMKGEIGVHSVRGHGSTFWFSVPLERGNLHSADSRVNPDLSDLRVLVVDDEENARDILHNYLVYWGMRNGTASNAEAALEILRGAAKSDPYSVAIIDLCLPETDGLQLGKVIREDQALKDTRLILVTAFDKPGTGEEAISLGFNGYLTKPIKQSQLLDCISSAIQDCDSNALKLQTLAARAVVAEHPEKRQELLLVAEDHPINQEVALMLLRDLGFEAQIAQNGQLALELMQRIPYALVFMDCQMPVLDGFDAARAIRKIETRTGKHIPIIAMTAHAIEGSREQCLAAGMDDYLSKPVDPVRLKNILEKWIPVDTGLKDGIEISNHSGAIPEDQHPPAPPIDLPEITKQLGARTIALELLTVFLQQAPDDLVSLKKAIAARDEKEVSWLAHQLKPVFMSVQANSLHALVQKIEGFSKCQAWIEAHNALEVFEEESALLCRHIEELLAGEGD